MAIVQRRIGAIFGLFFILLVVAAGRALYLGGVHSGALRRAARNQQLTDEGVPAQRGAITDRNGLDLAVSEPAQDISADPYLLTNPAATPGIFSARIARACTAGSARARYTKPRR